MSGLSRRRSQRSKFSFFTACSIGMEPLEPRELLSASHHPANYGSNYGHQKSGPTQVLNTIEFSQAPAAVQTGLDTLATADNLTDPAATQSVSLDNVDGVETYSVTINGTGSVTTLTVDENGNPVTAPTMSETTWASLGTSDAAAAAEIGAIATALNLTAPSSTSDIKVTTYSDGIAIYSVRLFSTTAKGFGGKLISVDGSGNPVGDQVLPFDVIPTAIQNALNSNAPSGATALASTSTQNVTVQTADGVTTYSTNYVVSGTSDVVTVNSSGQLTGLPTFSTTEFQDIPTAAQTELQTLANDYGVTGTVSATQSVKVYTESGGTAIYAVTLSASGTGHSGATFTYAITIASDENGNPTTLPGENGGNGFGGPGGMGGGCDEGILDGNVGFGFGFGFGFGAGPSDLFIG
jgi:hypothetical protein